jgi:FAD/FMN-containing dehydrogenase
MSLSATVLSQFRKDFAGTVITPTDSGYDLARRVWNGAVDARPALIVRPRDASAISSAVRFARHCGLPLAVLGGGYDWAGRSVRTGALVVDMVNIASVAIAPEGNAATVGAGAKSREVLLRAGESGLAAVAGAVGSVGIAAFTLSGGYGPLTPGLGLAVDNLLSVEIVLADGSIRRADEKEAPELLWALRGGGGNFGIVTSLDLRLHPVTEVLAGRVLYPWTGAVDLLESFGRHMSEAPDSLAATMALVTSPEGQPAVALAPCSQADDPGSRNDIDELTGIGSPILAKIAPMKPIELFSLFEANAKPGRRYAQQTRWLPSLGQDVARALVAAAEAKPSPFSAIAIQSFHGVPTRVPLDATAFPIRRPHFLVSIVAAWEQNSSESDQENRRWASATSSALAPFSLPGGYASLLGPDEKQQLEHTYGPHKERLLQIKQRFDPEGCFTANGPLESDAAHLTSFAS